MEFGPPFCFNGGSEVCRLINLAPKEKKEKKKLSKRLDAARRGRDEPYRTEDISVQEKGGGW